MSKATSKTTASQLRTDTQVSAWFPYDEPFSTCPACRGSLTILGALGRTMHYRCRDCGLDCQTNIN